MEEPKEILDTVWKFLNCSKSKPIVIKKRQHSTGRYWEEENKITLREDSWNKMHTGEKRLVIIHEAVHACGISHQKGFRTAMDSLSGIVYKKIYGEDEVYKDLQKEMEAKLNKIRGIRENETNL